MPAPVRTSSSRSAISTPSVWATARLTSCTPIRCCTLPDPVAALREMRGCASRAESWRRGMVTTGPSAGIPTSRRLGAGSRCTARSPAQRRRARRWPIPPGLGSRRGLRRGAPRRVSVVLRNARRPRVVGRAMGRSHDPIGDRASSRRRRPRDEDELRQIAEGWRRWAAHPDAWYAVLHGEISLPRIAIRPPRSERS